jgi:hypothetical protein
VCMMAFVDAALACLNVERRKNITAKYNLPVLFVHHWNDLSLSFILTCVRC